MHEIGVEMTDPTDSAMVLNFSVSGTVHNQNQQPLPDARVKVFSVRLREESLVGEAVTNGDGVYSIDVEWSEALRVRVFDDSVELAASPVRFPALDTEEFDFNVESSIVVPSEYERGVASIQAALDGLDLQNVTSEDLSFLAHETGIAETQLNDLLQAAQRSSGGDRRRRVAPGLPSAAWYAWRRSGFDVDDPAFWERSVDELTSSISSAAERGIVPKTMQDNAQELKSHIRSLRAEYLLDREPIAGGDTVRDLLATSMTPLTDDEERTVAEVLNDRQASASQLGGLLREAGVKPETVDAAVLTMKLAELAEGQASTVGTLQERAGAGVSLIGLAELPPDEWLDLAYRHGAPSFEGPQAYATRMQHQVETLHPTATLRARLTAGSIRLPISGGDLVAPFLADHPEFDISTSPIDTAIGAIPDTDGVDKPALVRALKTVRRIGSVTTGWDHVDVLLHRGVDSVERIAAMEPGYFASTVDGAINPAEAQIILEQAQIVQQTTAALVGVLRAGSAQGIAVLDHPVEASGDRHPSLRALFGPLESCECGHCRSLLSPAAYLVELLSFLQQGSSPAFKALLARRPDLVDLDLSCANGEVAIPAVDVALEVLENAVALPLRIDLPPGADLGAELALDPLPDEIVTVLKRTARDVAGNLRAVKEPQELQGEGPSAWTITDRDRRWTVHARPEAITFGSSTFAARKVSAAGLDTEQVRQDLDAGTIPPLLDRHLRDSMSAEPIWQAAVRPISVSTTQAGRSWTISYLFHVIKSPALVNATGDVSLTLRTSDGTTLTDKTYSSNAVSATESELAKGRLGGLLTILLPLGDDVRVAAGPAPGSFMTSFVLRFEISYAPRSLIVAALTYQSASGQDLRPEPRNRNPAAYEVLRSATFPWSLPLNLPLTEVRALLERAGVNRRTLLELLLAARGSTSTALARETLGMSPELAYGVTHPSTEPVLWNFWGLSVDGGGMVSIIDSSTTETVTGTPQSVLARISILMQQAALTHQEVLDVANSAFVRGSGSTPLVLPLAECVPSKLHLEPVDPGFFDRFHRFVRLRGALGWTTSDVDAALTAFTTGGLITQDTLRRLATITRLHEDTAAHVGKLISWFAPDGPASLPAGERAADIRRLLGLNEADYQRALRLTGVNPLTGPDETRLLIKALSTLPPGRFSLRELCYLGRHLQDIAGPADEPLYSEAGLSIALSDRQINAILSGLRAASAAIRDGANLANPDPAAALTGLGWYPALIGSILDDLTADLSTPTLPPTTAEMTALRRRRARLARRLRWASLPKLVSQFNDAFDPGVVLPQQFIGRIRLEPGDSASQTKIVVDGWLDPWDTAVLQPVLGAAASGALDDLVAQSNNWPDPPAKDRLFSEDALGQLYAAGSTPADRVGVLMLEVVRRLHVAAATSYLGQALQQPEELIRGALFDMLADPADAADPARSAFEALLANDFISIDPRTQLSAAQYPGQFAAMRKLNKVCVIASRTGLQIEQLLAFQGTGPAVAGRPGGMAVIDLNGLPCGVSSDTAVPIESWLRLSAFVDLRGRNPGGSTMMNAYLQALLVAGQTGDQQRTAALSVIAAAVKQPAPQVRSAAAQIEISGITCQQPEYLEHLLRLLDALKRLRATVSQANTLVADGLTVEQAEAAAQLAYSLLRRRYSDTAWDDIIRPVSDNLRMTQRDALVAYLVHRDRLATADALYEHYLIDTQSAPALITTRLLVATEAIQLFVNRCLLNLEPQVPPGTINRPQWEWMEAYRVWEAARKVFLRPQHWLRPELRLDASAAFRAVQSAFAQSEATPDGARSALLGYLDDLVDLSQITILGVYEDDHTKPGRSDLYLVGRGANPPYAHYWRVCEDVGDGGQRWRPWQRVDLDVVGSHVVPFVLAGDLHLAWAIFRKNTSQAPGEWEIQLTWAKRTSRGWTDKKVAPTTLTVAALSGVDEHRHFAFSLTHADLPDVSGVAQGLPAGLLDQRVAVISMFRAEDPKTDGLNPRPDVITSVDGSPGSLNFSCDVVFEDINGNRWPATDVLVSVAWGNYGAGPGAVTNDRGHVSQYFTKWPRTDLDDIFGPNRPRPADNDISLNFYKYHGGLFLKVKRGTSVYPQDAARSKPIKTWSPQIVLDPPPGVSKPTGIDDPERPLRTVAAGSFIIRTDRDATYQSTWNGQLAPPLGADTKPAGEPYDNGFRELYNRPDDELAFRTPGSMTLARVLAATPGRFVIVGGPSGSSRYWHYQDSASSFLIRVLAADRLVITADSTRLSMRHRTLVARDVAQLYLPSEQAMRDDGRIIIETNRPGNNMLADTSVLEQGVNFDRRSPSADSYWETFFHVPLLIADRLGQEQRYAEAQQWLRFVFDPTSEEARLAKHFDPKLYWQFRPFRETTIPARIEELVTWLADPFVTSPAKNAFQSQIEQWRGHPFEPHEVARLRIGAYEWQVVLAYVKNLLAWADDRFRRDTREALVEALMLYIEASNLLGPRPGRSPASLTPEPRSYRALKGRWDEFGNAWYSVADSPFIKAILDYIADLRAKGVPNLPSPAQVIAQLSTIGVTYFCVPPDEVLEQYWDTLEDRLFKIRHSQNIDGVERQLAYYAPPIDPALLVEAVAAGVDIGQAVAQANATLSPYRFAVLVQKANELCTELKSLGSLTLSALEKQDGEKLARIRSEQEVGLLALVEQVRKDQVDDAAANLAALRASREAVASRYRHIQYLLTGQPGKEPAEGVGIAEAPANLAFVAPSATDQDVQGLGLLQAEQDQLGQMRESLGRSQEAAITNIIGSVFFTVGSYPVTASMQGLGHAANALAAVSNLSATTASANATRDAILSGYQRRRDEWVAQSNAALRELGQIDKQIAAAKIRESLADKELANHRQQMTNAGAIDSFMRSKYSNTELYTFMTGQLGTVYFSAYQLALDLARQAEQALRYELVQSDTFIRPHYWDSQHRGLLAGEQLTQDLKRLEIAYFKRNQREHELTHDISLRQLDPAALLELRATGKCRFLVPEWLFDLRSPGHYLRRLKTVALSLPCVVGRHTAVHARLTLEHSEVRRSASAAGTYPRTQTDDNRFTDDFALAETVVTSGTVEAPGVWEPTLTGERRMPYEGRGAISTWQLELPAQFPTFDYATITDAILTMRFSARDGGTQLRGAAVGALVSASANTADTPHALLISLSQDFPTQWARLTARGDGKRTQDITIARNRLPYFVAGAATDVKIRRVDVFGVAADPSSDPGDLSLPALRIAKQKVPLTEAAPIEAAPLSLIARGIAEGLSADIPESEEADAATWTISGASSALRTFTDLQFVITYSAVLAGSDE